MPRHERPARGAVDILIREHDVIQRVLHLLETAANLLDHRRPVPEGFQRWSVEFFRDFADRLHHAKEEQVLFPALLRRGGVSMESGIARLVADHVQNRVYVAQLREFDLADRTQCEQFAALAHAYVEHLRDHIFREHNEIFAAAARVLTERELLESAAACERAEEASGTRGYPEQYVPAIRQWEVRFSPLAAGAATSSSPPL